MTATAPISEAQLAANRANAQHSTGPRSPESKSRVRLNGLRHGLTGQTVFLPDEDRAAYDAHHAEFRKAFDAKGIFEIRIARQIADEYWRLNRIEAIENNIFALGIEAHSGDFRQDDPAGDAALGQAQTFLERARELNLLSIYEQRLRRNVSNLQKELDRLRHLRLEVELIDAAERATLNSDAAILGTSRDGFGFSNGNSDPAGGPTFPTIDPSTGQNNSKTTQSEQILPEPTPEPINDRTLHQRPSA